MTLNQSIGTPKRATDLCRVLLVEDNDGDAFLFGELLIDLPRREFEVTRAASLAAAIEHLDDADFDVIVLDLSLPDSRGLETYEALRERGPRTPVVVLSGVNDLETARQAVQAGAQDYLVKGDVSGDLIARALRYAQERERLISGISEELEVQNRRLARASRQLETTLTTVRQFLDLLRDGEAGALNPEQSSYVALAMDSLADLDGITDELDGAPRYLHAMSWMRR